MTKPRQWKGWAILYSSGKLWQIQVGETPTAAILSGSVHGVKAIPVTITEQLDSKEQRVGEEVV